MKILSLCILIFLAGCDPYWSVRREADVPSVEKSCIRNAILNTEGVLGVIEMQVSQSYTLTGKKLPKPVIYQFETQLQNGFVSYKDGHVEVYFGGIGMTKPAHVEEGGSKYLEPILNNIVTSCKVLPRRQQKILFGAERKI